MMRKSTLVNATTAHEFFYFYFFTFFSSSHALVNQLQLSIVSSRENVLLLLQLQGTSRIIAHFLTEPRENMVGRCLDDRHEPRSLKNYLWWSRKRTVSGYHML